MSTMYSRSVAMLQQSKNALTRAQEDEAFLKTQEKNNSNL
jgi:hypothetical protein